MSSPRDDGFYGSYGKAYRSSHGADSRSSGLFQPGQGGRLVLPPISSAFPTSRSPDPTQHSNHYPQQRPSSGRNEFNVAPYGHQWPNNTAAQQHPSSFYDSYDPRYGATQYPSTRASPSPPHDPYDSRRLPPVPMGSSSRREEDWPAPPFTTHIPFSDGIRSPTASYPPQWPSHQIPQQTSYNYPPTLPSDTRNMHFSAASHNQHSHMHIGPHSSLERPRGKEAHPYARSSTTPQSTGYGEPMTIPIEEPIIKKKRKRANTEQLKVLNATYQRTAFPSTEERQALATELDMLPRSVQIWFQNKRQADRQSNRQPAATVISSALPDDPQVPTGSYGGNTSSMNPTAAGPLYLPRSSRDHSHHRPRDQEERFNRRY